MSSDAEDAATPTKRELEEFRDAIVTEFIQTVSHTLGIDPDYNHPPQGFSCSETGLVLAPEGEEVQIDSDPPQSPGVRSDSDSSMRSAEVDSDPRSDDSSFSATSSVASYCGELLQGLYSSSMRTLISDSLVVATRIEEFRRKHGTKYDISVVALSRIEGSHLPKLGIVQPPGALTGSWDSRRALDWCENGLCDKLERTRKLSSVYDALTLLWDEHSGAALRSTLSTIFRCTAQKGESRSRLIVNAVLLFGAQVLQQTDLFEPIIFTEQTLATKGKATPVIYERYATFGQGRVDYASTTLPAYLKGCLKTFEACASFRHHSDTDTNAIRFGMAESKDATLTKPLLENGLGQVLAEALLAMKIVGRNTMPWCLTNGLDWIFGVLFPAENGMQKKKCIDGVEQNITYTYAFVQLPSIDPRGIDAPADEKLKSIVFMVATWMSMPEVALAARLKEGLVGRGTDKK